MSDVMDYLGISGVIALILGAIGHGALHQRVKTLEASAEKHADNALTIARLEERVKSISSDIQEIKRAVVK